MNVIFFHMVHNMKHHHVHQFEWLHGRSLHVSICIQIDESMCKKINESYPRFNGIPTSASFTSSIFRRFGLGSESSTILISNFSIKNLLLFYHHHLILIHQLIVPTVFDDLMMSHLHYFVDWDLINSLVNHWYWLDQTKYRKE